MRWKGTHQNNGTENEVEDKYAFQGSFAFTLSLLIAGWLWLITIWPHSEICLSYWICIGFALVLFLKFAAVQLAVSCRYFIPTYSITALGWHFRPSVFEHFGIDNRTQLPYFLLGSNWPNILSLNFPIRNSSNTHSAPRIDFLFLKKIKWSKKIN